jgi:hypothetical protein
MALDLLFRKHLEPLDFYTLPATQYWQEGSSTACMLPSCWIISADIADYLTEAMLRVYNDAEPQ